MATARLADLLRSRSALSEDEIQRMSEDEAWAWIHANLCEARSEDGSCAKRDEAGARYRNTATEARR